MFLLYPILWHVVFSFALVSMHLKFPLWFLFWSIDWLGMWYLILTYLWIFLFSFCYWFFIPLWSEKIFCKISVFQNLLRLVLWPHLWSTLENVPSALEKNIYSLLVVECSVYVCQVWLVYSLVQVLCFLTDIPSVCSIHYWNGVLKSPSVIVDLFFLSAPLVFASYILGLSC